MVYDGNVIVPSYNGTLYDFSATDGSIRWKTKLTNGGSFNGGLHGSLLRATPVIDTADGLVLIGTWRNPVQPSALFALHLSDGSPAWTATGRAKRSVPRQYTRMVLYMRDGQAETNRLRQWRRECFQRSNGSAPVDVAH